MWWLVFWLTAMAFLFVRGVARYFSENGLPKRKAVEKPKRSIPPPTFKQQTQALRAKHERNVSLIRSLPLDDIDRKYAAKHEKQRLASEIRRMIDES